MSLYLAQITQGSTQALEKPEFSAPPLHPPQHSCTNAGLHLEKSLAPQLHWFLQAPPRTGDSKAKANTRQRTTPSREKAPQCSMGQRRKWEKTVWEGTAERHLTNKNKNKKGEEGMKNREWEKLRKRRSGKSKGTLRKKVKGTWTRQNSWSSVSGWEDIYMACFVALPSFCGIKDKIFGGYIFLFNLQVRQSDL